MLLLREWLIRLAFPLKYILLPCTVIYVPGAHFRQTSCFCNTLPGHIIIGRMMLTSCNATFPLSNCFKDRCIQQCVI